MRKQTVATVTAIVMKSDTEAWQIGSMDRFSLRVHSRESRVLVSESKLYRLIQY